mgnify:CR=1 FL=1
MNGKKRVKNKYIDREELFIDKLGRGFAWLDTGTHESLLDAQLFIQTLEKRQGLDNFFDKHRKTSEFVGKIGERLRFPCFIKDVKFIAKYNIHLVTCLTKEKNIVKFFFNREPDIQGIIEGKDVILTGKVKTHDISKFSNCKETVFNYVKIEQ